MYKRVLPCTLTSTGQYGHLNLQRRHVFQFSSTYRCAPSNPLSIPSLFLHHFLTLPHPPNIIFCLIYVSHTQLHTRAGTHSHTHTHAKRSSNARQRETKMQSRVSSSCTVSCYEKANRPSSHAPVPITSCPAYLKTSQSLKENHRVHSQRPPTEQHISNFLHALSLHQKSHRDNHRLHARRSPTEQHLSIVSSKSAHTAHAHTASASEGCQLMLVPLILGTQIRCGTCTYQRKVRTLTSEAFPGLIRTGIFPWLGTQTRRTVCVYKIVSVPQ